MNNEFPEIPNINEGQEDEFWSTQRVERLHRRERQVSPEKRFIRVMLVIFVLTWAIYFGMAVANTLADDRDINYVTADDRYGSNNGEITAVATVSNDHVHVILAVGCDHRENDSGRTDTIMLAFVNMSTGKLDLLSIPRDTYVTIPTSGSKTKINHAYAYGGISLTEKTIESTFGIEIDNYAEVDFEGFSALVDIAGGVTIDVPMDMYNADEDIDLKAGVQELDGNKALQFVRFREPKLADIGRIGRQQQFMEALIESLMNPATVFKIPELAQVGFQYVQTDLTLKQCISLAKTVLSQTGGEIGTQTVPGESAYINGVSYWKKYDNQTQELIDTLMDRVEDVEEVITGDPGQDS